MAAIRRRLLETPEATLRSIAEEEGASRETVRLERKRLVEEGALPELNRKQLGLSRNRARFEDLARREGKTLGGMRPQRQRLHDNRLTVKIAVGDQPYWEGSLRFRAPAVTEETRDEVLAQFMAVLQTILNNQDLQWPPSTAKEKRAEWQSAEDALGE